MTTWPCTHCGEPHSRRSVGLTRLRTCSTMCERAAEAATARARRKPRPICALPGCGKHVAGPQNRFCSRACAMANRAKPKPKPVRPPREPKLCAVCSKRVQAKRHNTCSRACAGVWKQAQPKAPAPPPPPKPTLRREAVTDPDTLGVTPAWKLRNEPAIVWRWSGG